MEELEYARKRGATIIGEVVGGAMAADTYHLTGTHPNGEGAVLGMRLALEDTGVQPHQIGYLNAHATSIQQGDSSELKAVAQVFGRTATLNISATKSMAGHLLGAAGAVETIACIMAIKEQMVPQTINTIDIDPEFQNGLDLTIGVAQKREIVYAMNNTFGFGGHIATSIFKRFE